MRHSPLKGLNVVHGGVGYRRANVYVWGDHSVHRLMVHVQKPNPSACGFFCARPTHTATRPLARKPTPRSFRTPVLAVIVP
jgi:hypothetical protein